MLNVIDNCGRERPVKSPVITGQVPDSMVELEGVTITFFENNVPEFVEAEMDRLYGNLYSSLAKFRIYGDAEKASTYVVRKDDKAVTVFLFQLDKRKVQVMNEVIKIGQAEIRRFAEAIFFTYKSVSVISLNAIQTDINRFPFPYQRVNCLEDLVLQLPRTGQEYLTSFGYSTRRTIKSYLSKIKQKYPSFSSDIYVQSEVSEQHILDILQLNKDRMAGKNKIAGNSKEKTQRIINLVKACGLVFVVTVEGRVCAGLICCRVNNNYFAEVVAHDPEYDNYRLGTLCCYLTICECIARGGGEFHFLWGRYEYKYRLLAVQRDLDHIAIYRSRTQFVRNGDVVLKIVLSACVRQVKLWLYETRSRNSVVLRLVTSVKSIARTLRRFKPDSYTRGK